MTNTKDKFAQLQEAWQSQCATPFDTDPDKLLKMVRFQRQLYLWVDILMVLFFIGVGSYMLESTFQDVQKDWPWLIYTACTAWVVGYILFNRWRQRNNSTHCDESMLIYVEKSIKNIEYQMWMDSNSFWWYILPIATGCMIPPVFFLVIEYGERPLLESLIPFLTTEVTFAVTFIFVYLVMKAGTRIGLDRQSKELSALRELRDTILNEESVKSD